MFSALFKPQLKSISASRSLLFTQTRTLTYKTRIKRRYNDGIDLKQQTIEINPNERIRRCSLYKDVDLYSFYKKMSPQVKTLGDALEEGCQVSNNGPCVGVVQAVNGTDSIQWLSYYNVIEKSRAIGSYLWKSFNLIPMQSKVAILSPNRPEYLFFEQACYMYGLIVVSLYTTYDANAINNILQRTEVDILVVDNIERVNGFKDDLINNKQLKKIFIMDEINSEENKKFQSMSSIFRENNRFERPNVDPNAIATFIMTSGTTGEPKIAMLSHENILATAKGHMLRLDQAKIKRPVTDRHCSFLPMAHVYERFILLQVLLGGTQMVFCPAPEKLVQYLSIVKPTQASVVPRVLNKVYDTVMTEVNKSPPKRFLIRQALREQPPFLPRFVFGKLRNLFGNNLQAMITGSAPITPDVMHFFRIALNIPIMEGYGQTESAGCGTSTHPIDMSYGTIGSPVPVTEIKLIDVPGTNYRSEMNQGEVCIRGPTVFKGYYKDEAKTREALDEHGWLHTGDVGEWTTGGALRIIDRTKHIFKLNQGRYIAPERLEDVYIRSQWIAQIFVDGNSNQSSIVAIVIPDEEYVRKHFPSATKEKSFADLCKDNRLKQTILLDLNAIGEKSNLRSYEIPSNIHLHTELFSQSNGLLTVTLKTRRANARKQFHSIMESLYKS